MKTRSLALLGFLGASFAAMAAAPASVGDDPVFRAMQDELGRAKNLHMDGVDRPYYVAAFVTELESFHVAASYGSLTARSTDRRRTLDVQVRVGTPELDNTNFSGGMPFMGEMANFSGGRNRPIAVDMDYDAIRQMLWLALDESYKHAAEEIARKRAYLETNDVKGRAPDFGPAPVSNVVLAREKLSIDKERWTKWVKHASAVFRTHPGVYSSNVSLTASVSHQYFLSSEGAKDRFAEPIMNLQFSASTQAADGMNLVMSDEILGRTEADLPKEADLQKVAKGVADRLDALAKAPTLSEDYTGPVLFTGRAAGQFFLAAIGEPLSSPRQALGAPVEGRLLDRLGKHIAHSLLTVRDDPAQVQWKGQPLLGYYPVDDDGVKPVPITLVDQGVLKTYYMSRVPTPMVKESNGHSRAGQGSVANLFVESNEPQSKEALEKKLAQLAKENDLDFGMVVEDLGEGGAMRSAGTSISLPGPLIAFRVFADGRRELVRGASFKPATFRALKDITAMGDDPSLVNTLHRGQRVSVVAPSVLVGELEVKRPKEEFEKPPFSPRPAFSN
jgi:TldD protein